MTFHILTIFPRIFDSYLKESILKRAREKGLIEIKIHNLRDFTTDKHKTVDDRPFGGGPGMVLKVEPIFRAIEEIKRIKRLSPEKRKIILFTPKGKRFTQKIAYSFSQLNQLIFICGRYEGIDERVSRYIADERISIGDYILAGGELPALIVIETVSRLLPGVLGNIESIEERRDLFNQSQTSGFKSQIFSYPVYTRPAIFTPRPGVEWKVPKVLLSGDHKKIEQWRKKMIACTPAKSTPRGRVKSFK